MRMTSIPGVSGAVSSVVLGTTHYGTRLPEDQSFAIMDAYCRQGGNLLDTANSYCNWIADGAGKSEQTIGKWLRMTGRSDVMVATKGADRGMTREMIREELAQSLDRLGVDSVAFYWLHCDRPDVPAGEIIGWLSELAEEGKFEAFGCSNWRTGRLREAGEWVARNGGRGFSASQVSWSLARGKPEEIAKRGQVAMDDEMFAYHEETALACMGYTSQAGGFFGGKYDPHNPSADAAARANVIRIYGSEANYRRQKLCTEIAAARGCSANQVALAYLFFQKFRGFAIVGPNSVRRTIDSCGGGKVDLTADEVRRLHLAK